MISWDLKYACHCLQNSIANCSVTKNAQLMYCWKVKQFKMLLSLLNSKRERSALGVQWSTDRDGITPCKTLKHTYYEESEGCEMWKLHQMDTTTENHHTSYSVPAGHPLISCVCVSSLVANRGKEHKKNSCISWVLEHMPNIYFGGILEAFRLFGQMSWRDFPKAVPQYKGGLVLFYHQELSAAVLEHRSW